MIDSLPNIDGLATHPLWSQAADGLLLVDNDGCIRAANPAALELFGYTSFDLVDKSVDLLVPLPYRDAHARHRVQYERDPVTRPMAASRLLEAQRSDGTTFPTTISLSRIKTADGMYSIAAVRDLSDRVAAEENAAIVHRQRLMAEDHDRIARELHDNVIQRLYALGLSMQVIIDHPAGVDLEERLRQAIGAVDGTIETIRQAINDLKRPMPNGARPRHQILDLVAELEPALGFSPTVGFSGRIESTLDTATMAELLPVLREGLTNVARHAQATEATVQISVDDTWVRLSVSDNGQGLGCTTRRSSLANMVVRAERLLGSLTIDSSSNGTQLSWQVPLERPGLYG